MAPQIVHFKGASSRGEKRKEIGASELTFDGRKKKKAPKKRQNSWKDLNSKVSLMAEEDLNLDVEPFRDPKLDAITDLVLDRQLCMFHSRQKGFDWEAQTMDIIGIYKVYGLNDAIPMDSQVELPELCTLKIPPLSFKVDGQMVDMMKEREVERPGKIELEGPEEKIELEGLEEMVKEMQQKDRKRGLI